MPIIRDDITQGTDEWFKSRLGRVSASHADDLLTATGKKPAPNKIQTYMYTLAGEIISGSREDSFKSSHMDEGNRRESESREMYSFISGNDVKEVGLVYLDVKEKVSCSPDGLIFKDDKLVKGLELKNPKMSTHIEYLLKKKCPTKYLPQVQSSMYICDVDEWDFMSFYPGLAPLIVTVKRNPEWIVPFQIELRSFLNKLDETVNKLRR